MDGSIGLDVDDVTDLVDLQQRETEGIPFLRKGRLNMYRVPRRYPLEFVILTVIKLVPGKQSRLNLNKLK